MIKLFLLIGISTGLAYLSECRQKRLEKEGKKEWLFYIALVIFLVFFAGLRYYYNDTQTYISRYEKTNQTIIEFFRQDFDYKYWIYKLIIRIYKALNVSSSLYIMFYTAFYVPVYVWFIRKYVPNGFAFAIFLFVVSGYSFLWAALKQVTATAIALIAFDFAIRKKWVGYIVGLIVAFLIHPSSIVFVITIFFVNSKAWSFRTGIMIISLGVVGVLMEAFSGLMNGFLGYDSEMILDHTVDPLRFAVAAAPTLLCFLYRRELFSNSDRKVDFLMHMQICETMFMFWALFGNPIMFARLSYYFSVGTWITFAWAINKLKERPHNREVIVVIEAIAIVLYTFVFIFPYISGKPFTQVFRQHTLTEFFDEFGRWLRYIFRIGEI